MKCIRIGPQTVKEVENLAAMSREEREMATQ